ncbi:hypothetical protein BTM25_34380 [Actinomadura rubteroloni]|uniref:CopC domain-containing protein n=1 Tax=Actinomadura rubteroloni TaxID=1926885 RepID=A0A2P4UIC9_9ACTN|nr:copper resistance CopC family protein [Actinomadura rubteroloni]POM24800.1 hypothetical protein BTM25_34380 [Actinomadura rubteroloni]
MSVLRRLSGVLVLGAVLATTAAAHAHAELRSSDPAEGAVLTALPRTMTLTFTERPSAASSVVTLGATRLPLRADARDPDALVADLSGVPAAVRGPVAVAWRSVSADDGHVADGVIHLSVGAASTAPAAAQTADEPGDGGLWLLVLAGAIAVLVATVAGFAVRRAFARGDA